MIACTCAAIHDGSACFCACHLRYDGRDGPAMLDADTVADLAIIGARRHDTARVIRKAWERGADPSRIERLAYAQDLQPLMRDRTTVVPWRVVVASVTAY